MKKKKNPSTSTPKKDRFQTQVQQTKAPEISHKIEQQNQKKADQKKKEKSPGFPSQHQSGPSST